VSGDDTRGTGRSVRVEVALPLSSVSGFLIADIVIIVLLYRAAALLERIADATDRLDKRDRHRKEGGAQT
jgi:hypothetical protein